MWAIEIFVVLAFCQAPERTNATAPQPLTVGTPTVGQLADAQSTARYSFTIRTDDVIELSLDSFDFDARLRVERETGELVGEDDDSGVETDARLVVGPGVEGMLVVVASSKDLFGEFRVALRERLDPDFSHDADVASRVTWRTNAEARAVLTGNERRAARHALERARILERSHQLDPALDALDRCIELASSCSDVIAQLQALTTKGELLDRRGRPELARVSYDSCVQLATKSGDRNLIATALGNLGTYAKDHGDLARAEQCFRQSRDIALELGDTFYAAMLEGNLGRVLRAGGRFTEATSWLESALAVAVDSPNRAAEAALELELGHVYRETSDMSAAVTKYDRARVLYAELGNHEFAAVALIGQSSIQRSLGSYAEARRGFEAALDTARRLSSPKVEASARSELSILDLYEGNYNAAADGFNFERSYRQRIGDPRGVAQATLNLATVHMATGAIEEALDALLISTELSRSIGDVMTEAYALGNLGFAYESLGDLGESLRCHRASLDAFVRNDDVRAEARAHGGLGNTLASMGRLEEAKSHYIDQLHGGQSANDPLSVASALANLGALESRLGNHRAALDSATKASNIFRDRGIRPLLIHSLLVIANSAIATGNADLATSAVLESESLLTLVSKSTLLDQTLLGLRDKYHSIYYATQDLTSLRLAQAGSESETGRSGLAWGFQTAGRWKGNALLTGIAEHRRGGHSAAAIELRTRRKDALAAHSSVLDQIAQSIQLQQPAAMVESLRRQADETLMESEHLADELRRLSPRDASLDLPTGVTFDDVRKHVLGPDDVLVDYVDGESRVYAYCVSQDSADFFDLGTKKEIAAEVDAFLSGITEWDRRASPAAVAASGKALFDRLLAPLLANLGKEPARLVVVPNAMLSVVPFEALVMKPRSTDPRTFAELEFVIDRFDVTYGPSSPVLVELASIGPRTTPGKLLLLADPVYESESITTRSPPAPEPEPEPETASILGRRAPPPSLALGRIEKTRTEAFAIADQLVPSSDDAGLLRIARLRSNRSGSASTDSLDLHVGTAASRDRITTDMREYAVIHLACHGYIDAEVPRRSGLVFSATPQDGGWFTIADALELDLDANLVVLSACQTARGDVRSSEGVESMARAFLYSGARAVVASLWDVGDVAAAETMTRTYAGILRDGRPAAQALLDAKRFVRANSIRRGVGVEVEGRRVDDETGHPNLWAPFIHIGSIR